MSGDRTILVVDDAAMFRDLCALLLARSGRVLTAASGEAGFEVARRERPDLVLADLYMTGMDGEALCRAIKSDPELCETPVIVVLSSDDATDRGRAIRAGADDLLSKPLSRLALVDAVGRFLRHEAVRGLPRAAVCEPVEIVSEHVASWGTMRNISRGGLFVETERDIDLHTEVALEFLLPETETPVSPSAEVIWHREANGDPAGLGLRFLEVDGAVARWLEDFVWEHTFDAPPNSGP